MPVNTIRLPNLVIPNGSSVSNSLEAWDADSVGVAAPAAVDALTYSFEVSCDNGTTWKTLADSAGNILPPAAGKARLYPELPRFTHFRIKASGNVGSDHTYQVTKQYWA